MLFEFEEIHCPTCNNTGLDVDNVEDGVCRICDGTGWIAISPEDDVDIRPADK